ncbi:MAG: hypothetical protein KDK91_27190, partial [Gammaproteobacteria bacterium]|nr:hypothetical protein [Gammaproteobacteria bacterium]
EAHRNRSYCNLNSARFDKTLRFAPGGKTCDDPGVQDVDLDVAEYLVYRFESEPEYSSFADTDGDGRGDLEERVVLSLNPPLTEPGTACDASSWPATAVNHRIGAPVPVAAAVVRESGRKVYRFEDPVPAANKGNVYWYRIMVRDTDGNLSPLSAPVRALFPERARPLRCDDRDAISERRCRYSATSQGVRTDPKTGDPYAVPYALDPTADAAFVRTTCQEADKDFADIRPLQVDAKGERVVPRTPALCEVLVDRCNVDAPMRIDFLSNTGEVLAGTNTSGAFAFCPSQLPASLVQQAVLRKSCEDASFSPVSPGSTLRGALALNCRPEPDECVNIYREIGGRSYHYKRFCPPVPNPIVLDPADLATLGGGEQTCLGIANVNQNAEVGSKLQFCFRLPAIKKPGPPNPIEIRFQDGSQKATLSWAAPQTPLAGTLVQWFMKGALENSATPTAFSDFFADAGVPAHNAVTQQNVDITPEPAGDEWQEEWCFRARAVGLGSNANLSDWSATRCGIRKPIVEPPPPNIPWPEVPATPKAPDMLARYMTVDKMPAILLSNDELDLYRHCPDDIINLPPVCRDGPRDKQSCLNRGRDGEGATLVHCNNLCALTRENVAANIGFVAYRRSSEDPNLPGRYTDFVQVSPLIDKVFCRQFRNPQIGTSSGVIDDPFVKLINFSIGDPQWDGFRFAFLDDYPHVRGRWYQYQLVFFDARGEPVRYRQTDWIQAP